MPRKYEAVYIFDSTLEDTAIQEKLTRFHELLSLSPETTTVDNWGRRQLAYPIGARENGYYTVARFEAVQHRPQDAARVRARAQARRRRDALPDHAPRARGGRTALRGR